MSAKKIGTPSKILCGSGNHDDRVSKVKLKTNASDLMNPGVSSANPECDGGENGQSKARKSSKKKEKKKNEKAQQVNEAECVEIEILNSGDVQEAPSTDAPLPGDADGANPKTDRNSNANRSCCFCWCCCCSCSCLSVKNNHQKGSKENSKQPQSSPIDYFNGDCGEPPPTLEEIRSWGDSFDRLMKCAAGRKVFRDFLKCEYSEENILFWLACEDLKKESNPVIIEEKARLIYEDYISILSPKEVSLDSRVREIINKNMVDPAPHTFDEAQLQIYTLMHRDSYPRFINSPTYRKLAQLDTKDTSSKGSGSSRKGSAA